MTATRSARSAKTRNAIVRAAKPRKAGRPVSSEGAVVTSDMIFDCAFELTKRIPLQDISVLRVARELNVTPALVHYYVGGREILTSKVMNAFYREACSSWPATTEDWRGDLIALSGLIRRRMVSRPGIAAYIVSHNKFRAFQLVGPRETDYGVLFLERFVGYIRRANRGAEEIALHLHLILEFIAGTAHSLARVPSPEEHRHSLDRRLLELEPKSFQHLRFIHKSLVNLQSEDAFNKGLSFLLDGLTNASSH